MSRRAPRGLESKAHEQNHKLRASTGGATTHSCTNLRFALATVSRPEEALALAALSTALVPSVARGVHVSSLERSLRKDRTNLSEQSPRGPWRARRFKE